MLFGLSWVSRKLPPTHLELILILETDSMKKLFVCFFLLYQDFSASTFAMNNERDKFLMVKNKAELIFLGIDFWMELY